MASLSSSRGFQSQIRLAVVSRPLGSLVLCTFETVGNRVNKVHRESQVPLRFGKFVTVLYLFGKAWGECVEEGYRLVVVVGSLGVIGKI